MGFGEVMRTKVRTHSPLSQREGDREAVEGVPGKRGTINSRLQHLKYYAHHCRAGACQCQKLKENRRDSLRGPSCAVLLGHWRNRLLKVDPHTLDQNVGTGLPDGPQRCTELPLGGRTVKDAGPYNLSDRLRIRPTWCVSKISARARIPETLGDRHTSLRTGSR